MTAPLSPARVMDAGARDLYAASVDEHGLACVCGNQATEAEAAAQIDHVYRDVEPNDWQCRTCADEEDIGGDR